jgi:hypothetical protein
VPRGRAATQEWFFLTIFSQVVFFAISLMQVIQSVKNSGEHRLLLQILHYLRHAAGKHDINASSYTP